MRNNHETSEKPVTSIFVWTPSSSGCDRHTSTTSVNIHLVFYSAMFCSTKTNTRILLRFWFRIIFHTHWNSNTHVQFFGWSLTAAIPDWHKHAYLLLKSMCKETMTEQTNTHIYLYLHIGLPFTVCIYRFVEVVTNKEEKKKNNFYLRLSFSCQCFILYFISLYNAYFQWFLCYFIVGLW